jgi:cytochrome P450
MRLYPPAYGVGREAIDDCEIGGFTVPGKSQVFMFQWAIQRDPRFFEEPDKFYPERWTEELSNGLPKYAYFPFGGGPRQCIGNYFAMMEMILIMAAIGQRFSLKLAVDKEVALLPAMSLRPKDPIEVKLEPR